MYTGKAVIIGDGLVGSTTAYTLTIGGLFSKISIIDIDKNKAEGDALDISHGVSFVPPVKILSEDYDTCRDADIIIIAAGVSQKSGEDRMDLLRRNYEVFQSIVPNITKYCKSDVVIIVVTNPVDILTYATYKLSGLDSHQIIGSGTVLDTSRLKYLISDHVGVDMRDISTYIIGEHGDSEVAIWSLTDVAGLCVQDYCKACGKCQGLEMKEMHKKVIDAAYEIIEKKGATYYAVALAVSRIVEAIVRNENSVLTVSSFIDDIYGVNDICLSLPTVMGKGGAKKILEVPLSEEEANGLKNSAQVMRKALTEIGL
ncbi:MAG: L-lactate dehydrogenase [Bacillota bacterium]|nr:L-lactate dehydrogenase [Bacillota bacterium]